MCRVSSSCIKEALQQLLRCLSWGHQSTPHLVQQSLRDHCYSWVTLEPCVCVCVCVCVHVSMLLPALHQAARMHIRVLGRGHKEKKKASRRNTISNVHDIDPDTCAGDEVLLWVNVQVVDHR